jgi:prepilin peptidase CpaA
VAGRFDLVNLTLISALTVAAVTDLRHGRIYNLLTYSAIVCGLMFSAIGAGPSLRSAIAGCLVGGLSLYLMFAAGWMGGGDVKLMAAVGAMKGYPFILHAMFYSIFVGGVCAAVALIWNGHFRGVVADLRDLARRASAPGAPHQPIAPRGGSFPFAVAIAIGTLTALVLEWRGVLL